MPGAGADFCYLYFFSFTALPKAVEAYEEHIIFRDWEPEQMIIQKSQEVETEHNFKLHILDSSKLIQN